MTRSLSKHLITCFSLMLMVLFSQSLAATDADGRMLVAIHFENGVATVTSVEAIPGAQPLPVPEGAWRVQMVDAAGTVLWQQGIRLNRTVYHDKMLADESLDGGRFAPEGTVVLRLPWFDGTHRVLVDSPLGERLYDGPAELMRRYDRPVVAESRAGAPLDFTRLAPRASDAHQPVAAAAGSSGPTGTLQVSYRVKGLKSEHPKFSRISVYSAVDQDYFGDEYIDNYSGHSPEVAEFELPVGTYVVNSEAQMLEDAVGKYIRLYPYTLRKTGVQIKAGQTTKVKLRYKLQPLVTGVVQRQDGEAGPVNISFYDMSKKYDQWFGDFFNWKTWSTPEGAFAMRLPKGNHMLFFEPQNEQFAAQKLELVRVKRKNNKPMTIKLDKLRQPTGSNLKQIWPEQKAVTPGSITPAGNGQLNILFIAEGYTALNEPFTDTNGNGVWDGEHFADYNGNGKRDADEPYRDSNKDGRFNAGEPFTDTNGDGVYNGADRARFEATASIFATTLLNTEPFDEFTGKINIYIYWAESRHAMNRMPDVPRYENMQTAMDTWLPGNGRFIVGLVDDAALDLQAASILPNVTVPVVMVNDPVGIFRSNARLDFGRILLSGSDLRNGGNVFTHELGHSVGNMGDEYYCDTGAVYTAGEPYVTNATIIADPKKAPWAHLIKAGTPSPTPWGTPGVGLFEGNDVYEYGIYRPSAYSHMRRLESGFSKAHQWIIRMRMNSLK